MKGWSTRTCHPGSSLMEFTVFGTYCLVSDLFTVFQISPLSSSQSVILPFAHISYCARMDVHISQSVCVCVCVSAWVFDMTRGDLPSFLFLSRHVIPRFCAVMVTVGIDSFSVAGGRTCVCYPCLEFSESGQV